ncbi:MAG: DNA replication/repair protein RecF [Clostridia bacterium]|nr:DNA replication/repair protein RecF [Clostridia bacterium]
MYIKSLSLSNYRNYQSLTLDLCQGTNIFYGNNGQGKTNLLEALFLCAIGKSFRYAKSGDLVFNGADRFKVSIQIAEDITEQIDISYTRKEEKIIRVNGLCLRKLGHLMGNLMAVIFSPEDLQLVNDGPAVRRRMMDIAISQIKASHYFNLTQYNKTLSQKNALLRKCNLQGNKSSLDMLDVYNEQLAESGAKIIVRRNQFIQLLSQFSKEKHKEIAPEENLEIYYQTDALPEGFFSEKVEDIKESFYQLLSSKKEKEIERMQSILGIHRDDIELKLNNSDLKRFGSQGQKRTAVLSMKLAELSILEKSTGRKPILLLDDVFSELDGLRQESLLKSIANFQTFITCTDVSELPDELLKNAQCFFVNSGCVVL